MSASEMPNWILTLILLIAFIMILVIIVAKGIPEKVAERLKYVIQVIWGAIP
jgi:hypothetical protein